MRVSSEAGEFDSYCRSQFLHLLPSIHPVHLGMSGSHLPALLPCAPTLQVYDTN